MTIKKENFLSVSLLFTPLLLALLPGCWPLSESTTVSTSEDSQTVIVADDGTPVLMKINGRPVITVKKIEDEFNHLLEENPNFKQVLAFMPEAKLNFFEGMVSQQIIDEYVHRNRIDQSAAYQKELEKTIEQVRRMLNMNYFSERHPVEVSEAEMKKFYDENKDKHPELVQSQGGVKAEGVSFNNEDDAKAFLAQAKESNDSFEKAATEAGYGSQYRDFKLVNLQSMQVDPTLRAKIVKLTKFPTVEIINVGSDWWVVKADSKVEAMYVPFDQVKAGLQEALKKQKQMEMFEKVIDTYKNEYGVEIDDAPLRAKVPAQLPEEGTEDELASAEAMEPATRTA